MIQTWKTLGWQTVLTMALATQGVFAGPEDASKKPEDKTTEALLKKLGDKLDALKGSVDGLKESTSADIKAIKEDNVKRDLQIENSKGDLKAMKEQIDSLKFDHKRQIDQLRSDIENLRKGTAAPSSVSGYQTAQPSGRIRLVNNYPTQMSIVVNGQSYRLLPNESRDLDGVHLVVSAATARDLVRLPLTTGGTVRCGSGAGATNGGTSS